MKKLFLFLLILLTVPFAHAQYTNVTATVLDPSGVVYTNCSYNVDFVGQAVGASVPYNLAGSPFQQSFGGAKCDSSGNLAIRLADNLVIAPTPSQWRFSICDSTGTKCFSTLITITGNSQSITGSLQAASASLGVLGQTITAQNVNGIRYANAFTAGADWSAKVALAYADCPATGCVIDTTGLTGNQTFGSSITMTGKPVLIRSGCMNLTVASGAKFILGGTVDFIWQLNGRDCSVVSGPQGPNYLFTFSGATIRHFEVTNGKFTGGGGSYVNGLLDATTGLTGNQGVWRLHNNYIGDFCDVGATGSPAVNIGNSIYRLDIMTNFYNSNWCGGMKVGYASDGLIKNNSSGNLHSKPQFELVGGGDLHFESNEMENDTNATGEDVLLNCTGSSQEGHIWFVDNKFGPEATENTTRYKVRIECPSFPTVAIQNFHFRGNEFSGESGSKPMKFIKIVNPVEACDFIGNTFKYPTTVIDDVQPLGNLPIGGACKFEQNTIIPALATNYSIFTNGGRGFDKGDTLGAAQEPFRNYSLFSEPFEIRNRMQDATNLGAGTWTRSHTAISGGTCNQADPDGGSTACLVTTDGTAFASFSSNIATGHGNRIWVHIWAKSGTLSNYMVGVFDTVASKFNDMTPLRPTDSTWREQVFSFPINTPANQQALYIYPGSQAAVAGNMSFWGVCVTDFDGPCKMTSGSVFSSSLYSAMWRRKVAAPGIEINGDLNLTSSPRMVYSAFIPGNIATANYNIFTNEKAIKTLRISASMLTAPAGCAVQPSVRFGDGVTTISLSLPNGSTNTETTTTQTYIAAQTMRISGDPGSGCGTLPANINVTVQYQNQ